MSDRELKAGFLGNTISLYHLANFFKLSLTFTKKSPLPLQDESLCSRVTTRFPPFLANNGAQQVFESAQGANETSSINAGPRCCLILPALLAEQLESIPSGTILQASP